SREAVLRMASSDRSVRRDAAGFDIYKLASRTPVCRRSSNLSHPRQSIRLSPSAFRIPKKKEPGGCPPGPLRPIREGSERTGEAQEARHRAVEGVDLRVDRLGANFEVRDRGPGQA